MRGWFLVFCILFGLDVAMQAQCTSLVPNGGFEENAGFPNDDCSWALANGWTNAATSSDCNSNNGTPDYFHLQGSGALSSLPVNYFSELLPFEGEAVMGIGGNLSFLPNSREYISIALSSPLVVGNTYSLSFSMTNGVPQVGGMFTDGWGVLLSNGPVFQPVGTNGLINPVGNLFSVPGVFSSQAWETFTFDFVADQPYNQLTFGNFLSDANQTIVMYGVQDFISLAYVFVDDFSLEGASIAPPIVDLGADIELCSAPILLDATTTGALSYLWNTGSPSNSISVNNPGLYYVDVEWECGVVRDSIQVLNCTEFSVSLGSNAAVCAGESVNVNSIITGGTAPFDYSWSVVGSANASSILITPMADITIQLTTTDATGLVATDEILIAVNEFLPDINLGDDQLICPEQSVLLEFQPLGNAVYQWSNGVLGAQLLVDAPGVYAVVASSACNTVGDTITFSSGEISIPPFEKTVILCEETEEVLIGPNVSSNVAFDWADYESSAFPRAVSQDGAYNFIVDDACGTRTFEVEVTSEGCTCDVFVPNGFTPNGDGINEYFSPVFYCDILFYEFKVYNRWGDMIFHSYDPSEKWFGASNGTGYYAQDGIYNYVLNVQARTVIETVEIQSLSGQVMISR